MTKERIEASARSALELVLEALKAMMQEFRGYDLPYGSKAYVLAKDACLFAEDALMSFQDGAQTAVAEQHKQSTTCGEPVAWITKTGSVWKTKWDDSDIPLYTTPPPVPEAHKRKPLTDEQATQVANSVYGETDVHSVELIRIDFARAIEAAHGIMSDTDGKE